MQPGSRPFKPLAESSSLSALTKFPLLARFTVKSGAKSHPDLPKRQVFAFNPPLFGIFGRCSKNGRIGKVARTGRIMGVGHGCFLLWFGHLMDNLTYGF